MASALTSILISTVVLGALYALLASGLSLIWSTLRVFNYAHGALLMLGAYVGWTLSARVGLPVPIAVILAVVVMALFGVVFEQTLIRPFLRRPAGALQIMVATLAAASILEGLAQLVWGPQNRRIPAIGTWTVDVLGQTVGAPQAIATVVAPLVVALVALWLRYTETGASIRATEQNPDLAPLVTIRPGRVYGIVFAIAAALAGAAGVLYGSVFFMTPQIGGGPLLTAFVVLVFGGTRSLWGTLLAAYIIGGIEAASNYWIGLQWSPVIVFATMIIVMLVRPEGLVARRAV